ncbi:MAG: hypothetical protein ACQGVC_04210 [Myxococcota bacterium]
MADPIPAYGDSGRLEDPQRGELLFELLDDQENAFSPRIFLPLRYITRLSPRAETAGMTSGLSSAYLNGQVVALLDIPLGTVSADGDYHIAVHRYRREDPSVGVRDNFEQLPVLTSSSADFLGWGAGYSVGGASGTGTGSAPIDIHIINRGAPPSEENLFTPNAGWDDVPPYSPLAWSDVTDEIDDLVPYPVARIAAREASPPGSPPAAWQVEFTYPRSRIRIVTVTSHNTVPGAAIVEWDAGTDPQTVDCSTPSQTLSIQVVDPSLSTRTVNVAFELANYKQTCGARAVAGDFQMVSDSFKGYDENGAESTSNWFIEVLPTSPAFQ